MTKPTALPFSSIAVLGLAVLFAAFGATGQPAPKVARVGYLSANPGPDVNAGFRAALRELGYVEGRSLVLEARFADLKFERLSRLAAELVGLGPDVLVAISAVEAEAAKRATATIPIVMVVVSDPVAQGLVASLARPGGNVTGLASTVGPEIHGKRLELLRELAPGAVRLALMVNGASPVTREVKRATDEAARKLGFQVHVVDVRSPDDVIRAFATMNERRTQALMVPSDRVVHAVRGRLAELSARAGLPAVYGLRDYVEAGGLASYGPSYPDLFRRAASYVDRILKGAKPAELPVEQPTTFEVVINSKAAKALGITIPPSTLLRADQVLE